MEDNSIKIYVLKDENNSIIEIQSSIFLKNTSGWKLIDEWAEEQDRYIYAHVDNGEYVEMKYNTSLFDELGRPNFHDDFILWAEDEKAELYPIVEQVDEMAEMKKTLEDLKQENEVLSQAVQDMILMTMKGDM